MIVVLSNYLVCSHRRYDDREKKLTIKQMRVLHIFDCFVLSFKHPSILMNTTMLFHCSPDFLATVLSSLHMISAHYSIFFLRTSTFTLITVKIAPKMYW
jgi:hypothetical protein